MKKYSESITDWLVEIGYTHCFFVPGGNSMHLLDGARKRMTCVAFVHEMSAAIAAEYFNQVSRLGKAFVLLTAGPGLTNALTGIAGAYYEGRELLIIGGQVKSSDLTDGSVRQRGIQEVNGVALAKPITVHSSQLTNTISKADFLELVSRQWIETPGPVFIEICLDVQAAHFIENGSQPATDLRRTRQPITTESAQRATSLLAESRRPIILIGGGLNQSDALDRLDRLELLGVPVMTTYNGADRIPSDSPIYFGRPNTWGMRYSNLLLGQSDLVIALGTRLGLQQTGFNWREVVPSGKIIHVDISSGELQKGHPHTELKIQADAKSVLDVFLEEKWVDVENWLGYCNSVKKQLPLSEGANSRHQGFHNPYDFLLEISEIAEPGDLVVPCSSGGAFTAFYQAFLNKFGQRIISNKSLASMGYGLAGAIGASLADRSRRVIHLEGDGGFSQNLQELATVGVRKLPIKTFLWCNDGYASIRMTQKNYFDGNYLGCDIDTGLGFPDWSLLGKAYGIDVHEIAPGFSSDRAVVNLISRMSPDIFIVRLHREQTFYPKIASRINDLGSMESEPLWQISPHLNPHELASVGRFLPQTQDRNSKHEQT